MSETTSSSTFTKSAGGANVGPPMIGALMRLPWEAVASRILRALHANGFDDIDAPQLSVLLWPGPDGLRPTELATRTRMTKQALNYLLGDLERNGYLERRPDPADRRARRIRLTDRGRALIPIIRGVVAETERDWAAALGKDRFAELRQLLVELNDVVAHEASVRVQSGEER
jgi:DNA-binding MarR family transcriptional regulator